MVSLLAISASLSANEPMKYGATELYSDIHSHATAFDSTGNLYIAKDGKKVMKITPDRTVSDIADLDAFPTKTHIWSMEMGKDGSLYCAAQDRVLKISNDGKIATYIKEDFTGPCGVTDIEFDPNGNLYLAYDDIVARYTPALKKTIVIQGINQRPVMQWIVGIKFDPDNKYLFLTNLHGKNVARYAINRRGKAGKDFFKFDMDGFPEYFAVSGTGDIYVSLPDGNCIRRIKKDGSVNTIECEGKLMFPTTLALNPAEENWLYIACRNGIYRTFIGNEPEL